MDLKSKEMKRSRELNIVIILLIVLTSNTTIAEDTEPNPDTIYVPDDYPTIHQAVENATDGDIIIARDGIYTENIKVNKQLTIRSENGSARCIIRPADSHDHIFEVIANYTNIIGFTIEGSKEGCSAGIKLRGNYCTILNNTIRNSYYGLEMDSSTNNTILKNDIEENIFGIAIYGSGNNTVLNNTIVENFIGIDLSNSDNNLILQNNISKSNSYGIRIYCYSSNNNISQNSFIDDGIYVLDSYKNKASNNTVNGKPLVYIESKSNLSIRDAGQVILINCSNITITGLNISNTDMGVFLFRSVNCSISRNNLSDNFEGIELLYSNNNTISENTISNNEHGIHLWYSNDNHILENSISSNNQKGIYIKHSNDNTISKNNILSNDWQGVHIDHSENNIVTENNISCNEVGIELGNSSNNKVLSNNISKNEHGLQLIYSDNNIVAYNVFVKGALKVLSSYHNVIRNNTVNGKPLICLESISSVVIKDAGQVILINCSNITVKNTNISDTDFAIQLLGSDNCSISVNNISNNKCGIYLYYSDNNTILGNRIKDNEINIDLYHSNGNRISRNNISSKSWRGIGIRFRYSNVNLIYLNNFNSNRIDYIHSYESSNIWNSTFPVNYTFRGILHTSPLGNYWSSYFRPDLNNDGIMDSLHSIGGDKDYYPLVKPFENYIEKISPYKEIRLVRYPLWLISISLCLVTLAVILLAYMIVRKSE